MRGFWRLAIVCLVTTLALLQPTRAATPARIALHVSLSGPSAFAGHALVDAVRFAVDEANAAGASPPIDLVVYDDRSTEEGSREVARQMAAGDALVVIGPSSSALGLVACPIYAQNDIPVIDATLHADELTDNATTFRIVVSTGEIGEAMADYLGLVLHGQAATVLYKNNGYGRPLAARFKATAERLGIASSFHAFGPAAERTEATRLALADPAQPPIVLGMTYEDAVSVLAMLRREGYRGPIFGTATMARASFIDLFADQPEEHKTRGFFADGAYAVSPAILDSANAETLAFADRYRARFGQDPSWEAVQGYDGANLAMAAVRSALAGEAAASRSPPALREAARAYLASLDGPGKAVRGLTGPLWFGPDRVRSQAVRMGRFHGELFESAPLQLVPVAHPDGAEIASGAVFETEQGSYARLQRVIYTGMFVNEVQRVDLGQSRFGADFYLWLRYAHDAGPASSDPTDIIFPDMISGGFDGMHPSEQSEMADGTEYRLWRVQGEFRNDFDLHRFPFDRQTLDLSFFNARAASDHIVYVIDRRSSFRAGAAGTGPAQPTGAGTALAAAATPSAALAASRSLIAASAFHDLSQWDPLGAQELREDLVADSSLGDLRRIGLESHRELSGFLLTMSLERRSAATLIKMLLPLLLTTLIMYSALYFPAGLVKEKITVAITGVLAGTVLLTAINNQLGNIGYTMLVEYAFYVFFSLGLLSIVSVLIVERLRAAKRGDAIALVESWTERIFLLAVAATAAAALMFRWMVK
jgi:ABC-type branched-subunit amino acid transport system substrate-binding protein